MYSRSPLRPPPSEFHRVPSQRATLLTSVPSMPQKLPPTNIESSKAKIVEIEPYPKLPRATSAQLVPSQRDMTKLVSTVRATQT